MGLPTGSTGTGGLKTGGGQAQARHGSCWSCACCREVLEGVRVSQEAPRKGRGGGWGGGGELGGARRGGGCFLPSSLPVLPSLPACPTGGTRTGPSARSSVAALSHGCPLCQTLWRKGRVLPAQSQAGFSPWQSSIPRPPSAPVRAPTLDGCPRWTSEPILTPHRESPSRSGEGATGLSAPLGGVRRG